MKDIESVGQVKGIGPKTEALFHKVGVYTIRDLLQYYPRGYEQFEDPVSIASLQEGELVSVAAYIRKKPQINMHSPLKIVTLVLEENDAKLELIWFRMPFLKSKLIPGSYFIYRGRIVSKNGRLVMEQPKIYTPAEYDELKDVLQPVYPLTAGLTNKAVSKAMDKVLHDKNKVADYLPDWFRLKYELADYNYALEMIHFPRSKEELIIARRRLVFDEFLLFIMTLHSIRESGQSIESSYKLHYMGDIDRLIEQLPYSMTGAQIKVWKEIQQDLSGERLMNRLVQGDVGSGKTILAVLSLFLAVLNGYQGALMAPTEVLARQHYEDISKMCEQYDLPMHPVLLTGALSAAEKRDAYERIALGNADVIIGTHALIQEGVTYRNLALVITDEQHRFGVKQREALAQKGMHPHVLVMSATPIPRTLAIILYGDLDISIVDELPAQRLPIKNCVVDTSYREKAYRFICKEVEAGRQAYVICPMVEDSENMEAENVLDYTERLKDFLPDTITVSYLHGKMKPSQKEEIMEQFGANRIQVLVSTTVIEVGINVPNATVMMIENAERFGLAQLHQLRGRVGRGDSQSYCIFVNGSRDSRNQKRLEILNKSNDGFYIASEDLKLRGPGDFFGIRQSGILNFRIADIYQDAGVLQQCAKASAELEQFMEECPDDEQVYVLRQYLEEYIDKRTKQLQL